VITRGLPRTEPNDDASVVTSVAPPNTAVPDAGGILKRAARLLMAPEARKERSRRNFMNCCLLIFILLGFSRAFADASWEKSPGDCTAHLPPPATTTAMFVSALRAPALALSRASVPSPARKGDSICRAQPPRSSGISKSSAWVTTSRVCQIPQRGTNRTKTRAVVEPSSKNGAVVTDQKVTSNAAPTETSLVQTNAPPKDKEFIAKGANAMRAFSVLPGTTMCPTAN
jgi:cell division septation protein DedD|tara:strand:- start:2353 stop:3036 length:684 start_codon:yes stop_codon:yes gene_type:complete